MADDVNQICFKAVDFLNTQSTWLKLPLFTILFDDGSLLLATTSTDDSEFILDARWNRQFLYQTMGISIISQLHNDFCDNIIVATAWCSTTFKDSNGVQFSLLFVLSKNMIRILKISMIQPGEFSDYAEFGLSIKLLEAIETSDIELPMDNICAVSEKSFLDIATAGYHTIPLYLSTARGTINRLDIVLEFSETAITVGCNHEWMIERLFESRLVILQSNPLENDSTILLSTGMTCGLVNHANGEVIKFPEIINERHFTSICKVPSSAVNMSKMIGVDIPENLSFYLTSSAEDTLSLWSYDSHSNTVSLIKSFDADLEFEKSGTDREYFASVCVDPFGLCVYITVAVPPLPNASRQTQLNIGLQLTNTRFIVYPMAKLLSMFFRTTPAYNSSLQHYENIHVNYRNMFGQLLERLLTMPSLDNKSSGASFNAMSFSIIPIYLLIMIKHMEKFMPIYDENIAQDLGIKTIEEIRQSLRNQQSSLPLEGNDSSSEDDELMDSSVSDFEVDDDILGDVEAQQSILPPKKTRRRFINAEQRKLAKAISNENKRASGGNFRHLVKYFTNQYREHIYRTINAFFDAACEIAAVFNSKQAKSNEVILPASDEEAQDILFRLTTGK